MQNVPDFDLEELEARLYGQVFHSTTTESVVTSIVPTLDETEQTRSVRQVSSYSVCNNALLNSKRYWHAPNESRIALVATISNDVTRKEKQHNQSLLENNLQYVELPDTEKNPFPHTDNNQVPHIYKNELSHINNNQLPYIEKDEQVFHGKNVKKNKLRNSRKLKRNIENQNKPNTTVHNQNNCIRCLYKLQCDCSKRNTNTSFNGNTAVNPSLFVNKLFNNNLIKLTPDHRSDTAGTCFVYNSNNVEATSSPIIIVSDSDDDIQEVALSPKIPDSIYIVDSDTNEGDLDSYVKKKSLENSAITEISYIRDINDKQTCADKEDFDKVNIDKLPNKSSRASSSSIEQMNNQIILPAQKNCKNENMIEKQEEISLHINSLSQTKSENDVCQPVKSHSSTCILTETERTEMLCTPDSTMNDFIENDLSELQTSRFNFNLHGSDLDLTGKGFIKPTPIVSNPTDIYETESSCSGTGTPTKNSAYSDLACNIPIKEIFAEPDLTSFSQFITPNRQGNKKRKKNKKKEIVEQDQTKASNSKPNENNRTEILNITNDRHLLNNSDEIAIPDRKDKKRERKKEKMKERKKLANAIKYQQCMQDLKVTFTVSKEYEIENIKDTTEVIILNDEYIEPNKEEIEENNDTTVILYNANNEHVIINNTDNTENGVFSFINTWKELKKDQGMESTDKTNATDINDPIYKNKIAVKNETTDKNHTIDKNNTTDKNNTFKNNSTHKNIVLNISPTCSNDMSHENIERLDKDFTKSQNSGQRNMVINPFNGKKKSIQDFWTDDMNIFYNESWGQENYDLNAVIHSMSSDASKWEINSEDKQPFKSRKRGPFCLRCREHGHYKYNCSKYMKPLKCSVCGAAGHFHARCPNLVCTTCGFKGGYHTISCNRCAHYRTIRCTVCQMMGHPSQRCPDLWRRYHLTTTENEPQKAYLSKLKAAHKQWCSGCARRGHLQHDCKNIYFEHFPSLPQIVCYDPTYNKNNYPPVGPQPLLPEPNIPYFQNVNLSQLTNYKDSIMQNNNKKYGLLLKNLRRKCEVSAKQFLTRARNLERDFSQNNFDAKKIASLYRLKTLIRKHETERLII